MTKRTALSDPKRGAAERHVANEAVLRASEDRYRALVDKLDDLVFSLDDAGLVNFVNRAIARFGYRPEEVIGRPMEDFLHPEDRAAARADLASCLAGATRGPHEFRWVDALGRLRYLRSTTLPFVLEGRIGGLAGIAVDVTEQREAEEKFRAAQRMEAIGLLAGGMAHDVNNLLSVILTYTERAVAQLREDDPLRVDLQEISRAGWRAAGLTRQLLAFGRRQVLEAAPADLGALVAGLGNMLQCLIGEDIELQVAAEDGLFMAKVDRGQLEQVVMNLVVNARDAMPDGGKVNISSANVALDSDGAAALEVLPGEYVKLSVSDTGSGMDPNVRARIFEPFFTTKELGKGTGLGLSTVHSIVKQSRGGISVDTAPGRGTTFHVFLPRHVGEAVITTMHSGV